MNQVKLLRVHFTPDRADTMVYTEKRTVHRVYLATGTPRALVFQGFEADRDNLKYRCPAAAYGLDCQRPSSMPRSRASESGRLWTHCPHRHHGAKLAHLRTDASR